MPFLRKCVCAYPQRNHDGAQGRVA